MARCLNGKTNSRPGPCTGTERRAGADRWWPEHGYGDEGPLLLQGHGLSSEEGA